MTPAERTGALAVGLALASAALLAEAPAAPVLDVGTPAGRLGVVAAVAALFLLAELCLLHVEVGRQAFSVTLAGVPLGLGVLLCESSELVLARLLGSAAAFALQRTAPLKAWYNLSAYAFEAALVSVVVHQLVRDDIGLTARTAVACSLVLLAVDQLMSSLVTLVMGWHHSRLTPRQRAEVHLPALVCSVLATAVALGLLLLSAHGTVGVLVIGMCLFGAALAYRAFQVLYRRHQALSHVHGFVALDDGDASLRELAGRMLEQTRTLMRAGRAELVLLDPDVPLHLTVGEDGTPRSAEGRRRSGALDLIGPPEDGAAVLLPRSTRDRAARAWLVEQGVRDAIVVPLPGECGSSTGALMVFDRLGDTGSFTGDDRTLLQTLAGHLAVALGSGRRRDRLRYEATHDVLTGLGNRALLNEALHERLTGSDRDDDIALLLLDLDKFKEVNDTLGHSVGDALLSVIAERLVSVLPSTATVVRLGGDEFAALVPCPRDAGCAGTGTGVEAVARQVADALSRPLDLPEATLSVSASIGIALVTAGCTASDLLRHADTAMYAAKESQSGVVVYSDDLDRGRAERLALLADLHLALERQEFYVLYQPKLDLCTDELVSVEALVRWKHPQLGPLSPDVFVPLAEANGLIRPLTRLVLDEALRQCAAWREDGLDLTVAVNLSAHSVNDPGLPEQISSALFRAGVPASRLILEVTESAVMEDLDRAVGILERIASSGVSISLDDFGTGYSSLSHLQRLPVCEVKIDRSFISGLTADRTRSQVLVTSIVHLGAGLGLRVVAEGVEDARTTEHLRRIGCHVAQGHHISRPLGADGVRDLFRVRPGDDRLSAVSG